MEERNSKIAVLCILSIPVLLAISGLITEFNILDFSYLSLVAIIFGKYYFISRKQN